MASMPAGRGMIGTPADDVLDRTAEISQAGTDAHASTSGEGAAPAPARSSGLHKTSRWLSRAWQFLITQGFSSLTRRIVFLNVTGLLALSIGITFLSQFRAGLIDARVQSLLVQGQIIAGAIAASATV